MSSILPFSITACSRAQGHGGQLSSGESKVTTWTKSPAKRKYIVIVVAKKCNFIIVSVAGGPGIVVVG